MGKNLVNNFDQYEDSYGVEKFKKKTGKVQKKRDKINHRKNFVDFSEID